eukprot:2006480-Amphidinium_carterae.1
MHFGGPRVCLISGHVVTLMAEFGDGLSTELRQPKALKWRPTNYTVKENNLGSASASCLTQPSLSSVCQLG